MEKQRMAFLLILVGGLIILLTSLATMLLIYIAPPIPVAVSNATGNLTQRLQQTLYQVNRGVQGIVYIEVIIGIVSGLILIVCALFIRKKSSKLFPAIALVFSAISLFSGGGLIIGFVLALAGSIIGLMT